MIKLFTSLLLLAWFSVPEISNAAVHHERYPRSSVNTADTTVILIHGWSCDSTYWSEQLPALRQHFDVTTIDLAGHGKTAATRDDFSMASFGRDVAEVVARLPTDQSIILVGHSMGGPVAVEAALLLGERVRGVIGVDTFASIGLPNRSTVSKPNFAANAGSIALASSQSAFAVVGGVVMGGLCLKSPAVRSGPAAQREVQRRTATPRWAM